jgi:DNA-binding XRE family transcriptional regulator
MNNFDRLVAELKRDLAAEADVKFEISEPARADGLWFFTLQAPDGYWAEVEWSRHRGFGVNAGFDPGFFEPRHESYGSWDFTASRVKTLWSARESTSANRPVPVAELRKLRGQLQKDVAEHMGITKGGLSQIEASVDQGKVQVDTLSKLLAALGGRLVLSATFPDGTERKPAVGR